MWVFRGFNDQVCVPPSDLTYTDDVRKPRHSGSEQKIQISNTRRVRYHHICSIYCFYSLEIIVWPTFIDFEMYCVWRSPVSLGPRFFTRRCIAFSLLFMERQMSIFVTIVEKSVFEWSRIERVPCRHLYSYLMLNLYILFYNFKIFSVINLSHKPNTSASSSAHQHDLCYTLNLSRTR